MVDHDRYRHISESSLDVHHGDSNISMINENSMDMIHQNSMMSHVNENSNISVGNEDSIDMMVHRNSISRPALNSEDSVDVMMRRNSVSRSTSVCENSVDCSNASMVAINGEASNSAALHPTNPSLAERASLSHQLHPSILSSGANSAAVEKVMDLRMKMPMATVSDLVNTTAPSMATLQRFGFEHSNSPLPAQSAQSVENYLTKIESKSPLVSITNTSGMMMKNEMNKKLTHMINTDQNVYQSQKVLSSQVMSGQTCGMLTSTTQSLSHLGVSAAIAGPEPVYLSSARPFLSSTTQNEALDIVTKSEAADIGEQTIPEPTSTITSTAITTPLERSVPTPINTERLDALVNSTVESHLSPTRTETAPKDMIISNVMPLTTTNSNPPEVMITSQDVMLNSQSSLMVPPIINTRLPSPILGQQELSNAHASPNLSPEVIPKLADIPEHDVPQRQQSAAGNAAANDELNYLPDK
ncbi:hypothetical protein NQ318_007444 [Aromia moschata]|uniref:Uncharacterized protein n=1 Tax=Aromia moschata TaxID=1265417 RepID=A0AAV8YM10_9CUCU|nr:hypothetical protein NQ318_007444 [Aromia moschata]